MEGTAGMKALRLVLDGLPNSKETRVAVVQEAGRPGNDRIWWMIWRGEAWSAMPRTLE